MRTLRDVTKHTQSSRYKTLSEEFHLISLFCQFQTAIKKEGFYEI
jgi:hypothetical protein